MRFRLLFACLLVMPILPVSTAEAITLTWPGCGATFQACVNNAPTGATIELMTNGLVQVPADGLRVGKALTIQATDGYTPKLGRHGDESYIDVVISPSAPRTVVFRGIFFKQVSTSVEVRGDATGHRVIFENNKVFNDSGTNGSSGISVYYSKPAEGSIVIRNNNVSSAGVGIEASASGGPLKITGNTVTSPVFTDSQGGIHVYASGDETVKGTIANNVIHGVSGCGCGMPAGIQARAFNRAVFDLRILNNTISPATDEEPSAGQAYGIVIVDPYSDPNATLNVSIYSNTVTNAHFGIVMYEDDQVFATGDRNNTFNVTNGDTLGSYDFGTMHHYDPLFTSETDFTLQAISPLVDAGRSCISSIRLPRGDAGGMFRYASVNVDVGAYEYGSSLPGSVAGRSLNGTDDPESLDGGGGVDVLCGLDGDDEIQGKGSIDFLFGGDGDDSAFGNSGDDFINVQDGSEDNDAAHGGPGNDTCVGDVDDSDEECELSPPG